MGVGEVKVTLLVDSSFVKRRECLLRDLWDHRMVEILHPKTLQTRGDDGHGCRPVRRTCTYRRVWFVFQHTHDGMSHF